MKIEIVNYFSGGHEVFFWTLYDGPDGCDRATGHATSLEEALNKIHTWRQRIANDYIGSINEEECGETVGDGEAG
jgi:hypothetical protein